MAAQTTPIVPLINPSGAGTVLPIQPTPPPVVPNSIGLEIFYIYSVVFFFSFDILFKNVFCCVVKILDCLLN